MNQAQLDGITKARLSANIAQVSAGNLYPDDAAYIAKVCADANLAELPIEAADSYAAQYAGKTILELETELAEAITATSALPNPPDLPPPTIAGVPQEVTMRQARLALLGAGLLDNVNSAIATAGQAALIEWEFANSVVRGSPFITQLGAALGMTDAQIDALFVAAAGL